MATAKKYPSQAQEQFVVRLPDGMRERIAEAAAQAKRSMNAEIVHRLTRSFVGYLGGTPEDDEKQIDALFEGFVYKSGEPNDRLMAREIALLAKLAERMNVTISSLQHTVNAGATGQVKSKRRKRKP